MARALKGLGFEEEDLPDKFVIGLGGFRTGVKRENVHLLKVSILQVSVAGDDRFEDLASIGLPEDLQ